MIVCDPIRQKIKLSNDYAPSFEKGKASSQLPSATREQISHFTRPDILPVAATIDPGGNLIYH